MEPAAPRLVAVLAMADNHVIGRDGALPWRLPDDLRRFKALTLGHPVLMGRRTYDSLGRPLPGRDNIVLTRAAGWQSAGVRVAGSLEEALALAGPVPQVMVIGGAEIYRLCWPRLSRIELTRVHGEPDGDTVLEGLDWTGWQQEACEPHPADERHHYPFSFVSLVRAPGA